MSDNIGCVRARQHWTGKVVFEVFDRSNLEFPGGFVTRWKRLGRADTFTVISLLNAGHALKHIRLKR